MPLQKVILSFLGLDSMGHGEDAHSVSGECGQHFTVIVQCDEFHVILTVVFSDR